MCIKSEMSDREYKSKLKWSVKIKSFFFFLNSWFLSQWKTMLDWNIMETTGLKLSTKVLCWVVDSNCDEYYSLIVFCCLPFAVCVIVCTYIWVLAYGFVTLFRKVLHKWENSCSASQGLHWMCWFIFKSHTMIFFLFFYPFPSLIPLFHPFSVAGIIAETKWKGKINHIL